MRHIYATIMICTTASLGLGIAQDIPTDTSNALAGEWKAPATTLNCLTALRLHTTYTANEGDLPLSPPDAVAAALRELLKGVSTNEDLYTVAQKQPDVLDGLTKANTLGTSPENEDALFGKAIPLIQSIYISKMGKQKLAAVQEFSAQKSNDLAIFKLLDAYPRSNPIDQAYADNLEILRACYKVNAGRLFKLVGDKIVPAKK
jgi:hypothetical protein